jgi:hypothetical protein
MTAKNRLTKLEAQARLLLPTWDDLLRLIMKVAEGTATPAEIEAIRADVDGRLTDETATILIDWVERHRERVWDLWNTEYPRWQDAPFWKEIPIEANSGRHDAPWGNQEDTLIDQGC